MSYNHVRNQAHHQSDRVFDLKSKQLGNLDKTKFPELTPNKRLPLLNARKMYRNRK